MKLLVLGGNRFLGRAVVTAALRHRVSVTTFNRGLSGSDIAGARLIRGDRTSQEDLDKLRRQGPWDSIIDVGGRLPSDVTLTARTFASTVERYAFVSSVSAYEGWPKHPVSELSKLFDCPSDAGAAYPFEAYPVSIAYGKKKAGCERAVIEAFGVERSIIVRPTVTLGPEEYVGRLPWWLRRIARGGPTIAPGPPTRLIQPIDVRDVADFILHAVSTPVSGAFNLTGPSGRDSFVDLLTACQAVTGANAQLLWLSDEQLKRANIREWTELPLWRPPAGTWAVDSARAYASGLSSRSLISTVADTWNWLQTGGVVDTNIRSAQIGLDSAKEAALIHLASHAASTNEPDW